MPIAPIPFTPEYADSTCETPRPPPVRPTVGNLGGLGFAPGVTNSIVPVGTLDSSKDTESLAF